MIRQKTKADWSRQIFFDKTVHHEAIKNCISGQNETRAIVLLESLGYVLSKDFVRQHPIGEKFVLDFAFIPEQVALEIDGESHNSKKQTKKDSKRDSYLRSNNWVALRIKDEEMFGYKGSFYRSLIREVVEDRRKQWEAGTLFPIDIPNYVEEDYE